MHGVNPQCIAAQSSRFTSSHQVIGQRTESDRTANGIRSGGERNPIGRRTESGRGCSCLSCTNKADRHVRSVDALITRLVHLLLGWCTYYSVGALITRLVHLLLGWCTYYSVGALETSAPPERHQHLCRSVKSVGLILSKSEFRGSCWQGVQLSQLHQQSKRREYSHRIRGTHRTVWRRCAAHR